MGKKKLKIKNNNYFTRINVEESIITVINLIKKVGKLAN